MSRVGARGPRPVGRDPVALGNRAVSTVRSAAMAALWPEEYEALRDEARTMAKSFGDYLPRADPSADRATRIAQMRARMEQFEVTVPEGTDETIAGVSCRVIRHAQPRATYVHFHGGGMMYGTARQGETENLTISKHLGVDTVSVDYRLAPEHPFPAGSDDCFAVAAAVLEATDRPILLGGGSAGATHAATTTLRIRDELDAIDRVAGVNLIFGLYDFSQTPSLRGSLPSDIPDVLGGGGNDELLECYLPGRTREELRTATYSPLYADLHDLPPALFTVGTADHLLDDSLFMAARWQAWGNQAELAVYPDCIHAFVGLPIELAARAKERMYAFLERCLA